PGKVNWTNSSTASSMDRRGISANSGKEIRSMRNIAVIYGGSSQQYRTFHEPKYEKYIKKVIYFPDFEESSLEGMDVLIVPSQLNLRLVMKMKTMIIDFARDGGTIVAFGPQPKEWIPGQDWELRETNFWWWLEENARSGLT